MTDAVTQNYRQSLVRPVTNGRPTPSSWGGKRDPEHQEKAPASGPGYNGVRVALFTAFFAAVFAFALPALANKDLRLGPVEAAQAGDFGYDCEPAKSGTAPQLSVYSGITSWTYIGGGQVLGVNDQYTNPYEDKNNCASGAADVYFPALSNQYLLVNLQMEESQLGEDMYVQLLDSRGYWVGSPMYMGDHSNGNDNYHEHSFGPLTIPAGTYGVVFSAGPDGESLGPENGNPAYGGSVHINQIRLATPPAPPICILSVPSSVTPNTLFNVEWSSGNATHVAFQYGGNTLYDTNGNAVPTTSDLGSTVNGSAPVKMQAASGSTNLSFCFDQQGTSGSFAQCQSQNPNAVCSQTVNVTAGTPSCTLAVNGGTPQTNLTYTYAPGIAFDLTFSTTNSTHGVYSLSGNPLFGDSHVSREVAAPTSGDLGTWPYASTPLTSTGAYHVDAASGSTNFNITVDNGGAGRTCSARFVAPVPTLRVQPSSATIGIGGTRQYEAFYDPDGSGPAVEQLVTSSASWSSVNSAIATVDNASQKGFATGASPGTTQIVASYQGLTDSGSITVGSPSLTVAPTSATVAPGGTRQYAASYDPDGAGPAASQDVTANAAWSSGNSTVATVSDSGSTKGLATGVAQGTTQIVATYLGLSDSGNLTVSSGATFVIAPPSATVQVGNTTQFRGLYDPDGPSGSQPEQDVTTNANWSSANAGIATVDNASSKGLATGVAQGGTTIRATYSGINATASITVTPGGGGGCCSGGGPTGATATAGAVQSCTTFGTRAVLVEWRDNSSDEDGFIIERASAASGPWSEVGRVGAGIRQFLDNTVPSAGGYFWRVMAFKGSSVSTPSNAAATNVPACTLPPAAPTNLQANVNACAGITLTWLDNATNETGFTVERKRATDANFTTIAASLPASSGNTQTVTYVDAGAANGFSYEYRVRAFNAAGSSAAASLIGIENDNPTADFSVSPSPLLDRKIATFRNLAQAFAGATITNSLWTFSNGIPATVNLSGAQARADARTIFQTMGAKAVTLKVTDSTSRACSLTRNVTVDKNTTGGFDEIPPD